MRGWRQFPGLAAALVVVATAAPALATPALWRVSDADSSIWLFGAVHILDQPRQWRSPAFDAVLNQSREVWFEMVLDAPSIAEITRLSISEGYYRDGTTLWSHLDADQTARVERAISAAGLGRQQIGQMRPWLASATLGVQFGGGLTPLAGVEMTVGAEIAPERQRGLETAAEQFAFIGGLPEAEQISDLLDTADAVANHDNAGDTGKEISSQLYTAWISGDQVGLSTAITKGIGGPGMRLFDRLIGDRNRRWVPQTEQLLEENVPAIVIVGAGHLVGPYGVPAMLARAGYTVTRVEDAGSAALDGPRMGTGLPR